MFNACHIVSNEVPDYYIVDDLLVDEEETFIFRGKICINSLSVWYDVVRKRGPLFKRKVLILRLFDGMQQTMVCGVGVGSKRSEYNVNIPNEVAFRFFRKTYPGFSVV